MLRKNAVLFAAAFALLAGCGEGREDFIRSGEQYMANQDFAAAAIQFRNAVQASPDDARARMLLARASLNSGDVASAEKEARKALELGHSKDAVIPLLARIHLARGDADAVVRESRENDLTDPAAQADFGMLLGVAYLELGKFDQAEAAFEEVLQADATHLEAKVGRAKVRFVRGDQAGAAQVLDEILAMQPALPTALSLKAELAYAQGDKEQAIEIYQRIISGNAQEIGARFRLGLIRLERGEMPEAQRLIDEIGKAAPRDPRGPYLSAVLAWRQGNAKLAAERTALVLRVQPDHAPSILLNGLASLSIGQLETAKKHLDAVRKHPIYMLEASRALAQAHLLAGEPDKAVEVAEAALVQGPNDPTLQGVLAEAALAKGNIGKATSALRSSAEGEASADATAKIRLGQALLASGDASKGIGMLESAAQSTDDTGRAALTLALTHLRQQNYAEALSWIARLESKQPNSANAAALRGMVYAAQKKNDAARKSFETALQREPDSALALDALGRLDIAQGKPADARTRYNAALVRWPGSEAITMSYVAWLRAQGAEPDEVLSQVNALIVANPQALNAQLARVDLLLGYGRARDAVQGAQELVSKRPDSKPAFQALAKAQLADGQREQAITTYRRIADLDPGSEIAWMRLADAAAAAGQHATAITAARKMLEIRPESPEARQRLVRSHALLGEHDAALKVARELQSARPGDAQGYILEADIEASRRQFDAAANVLRKALDKSPDSSSAASKLHDVLTSAGQTSEADRGLESWLSAHPRDTHARSYLAQRRALEGKYDASRALFQQVVKLLPNDADAINNLAWVSGKLHDPQAITYAQRAVALRPDQASYLETLGALMLDSGRPKEALTVLQRAVDLQPQLAITRLTLAKALVQSGDRAAGKRHLEALLAGSPSAAERKEAQALLASL